MSMAQIRLPSIETQYPQLAFCGDLSLSVYAEPGLKAPTEFVFLEDAN